MPDLHIVGVKSRALHMLGKHDTTELCSRAILVIPELCSGEINTQHLDANLCLRKEVKIMEGQREPPHQDQNDTL